MDFLRRTWAEISTSALLHNFGEIKKTANGSALMAVVKANAYGHYAEIVAPLLQKAGADAFAVSNLDEALKLRSYGINKPILILGYTPVSEVSRLYDGDIIQAVFCSEYADALNAAAKKQGVTIKAHIKLDTGMGRIGFDCRTDAMLELAKALSAAKLENLNVTGIFTHFAAADRTQKTEDGFTDAQRTRFEKAISAFKAECFTDLICHCSNSAAICLDSDKKYDMARAGIILYGLTPNSELTLEQNLVPVMSFKTVVAMVKDIAIGDTVSYGRTFKATRPMRLATLPVGYADGYPRLLSNKGFVLIRGKRAPIIGRVCMDQTIVDVTDIEGVCAEDEVLLFGKELPVEELAKLCSTINYEIVCGISPRVPRITV